MLSVLSMHRVHLHLCAVCSLACDVIHSSCDVHADDHILVNYTLCTLCYNKYIHHTNLGSADCISADLA